MPYEVLSHTADAGVQATAPSFARLIEELATGMFRMIAWVDPCPSPPAVVVEVDAATKEDLVVELLSALLYESEVEDLVLCGFETTMLGPTGARVAAGGVPTAGAEIAGPAIKAVTYHGVVVEERPDGWFGKVYFDV